MIIGPSGSTKVPGSRIDLAFVIGMPIGSSLICRYVKNLISLPE